MVLDERLVGDKAPLLDFLSMGHRPGAPPGVSPTETRYLTMYWLEGVLVDIALVVDGAAVTEAVAWGIEQGRTSFQVVVLSLFQAAFAEVFLGAECKAICQADQARGPVSSASRVLRQHTSARAAAAAVWDDRPTPSRRAGLSAGQLYRDGAKTASLLPRPRGRWSTSFDVAANRRLGRDSGGNLPSELFGMVVDSVADYDTWKKTCLRAASVLRLYCLRRYRLDGSTSIVAGPHVRSRRCRNGYRDVLSFDFAMDGTGELLPMVQIPHAHSTARYNWSSGHWQQPQGADAGRGCAVRSGGACAGRESRRR